MKIYRIILVGLFTIITIGAFSQVNVIWSNPVGVTVNGNSITKTSSSGWNARAYSANVLPAATDGWTQFTATQSGIKLAFGLTEMVFDNGYTTMHYALVLQSNKIYIYIYGNLFGTFGKYNTGDVFKIQRTGNVVVFSKNNIALAQVNATTNVPLVVDGSIFTNGATISNAVASFIQPLTITSSAINNVHCSGANLGSIFLTVAGGVPPYTYSWNNGGANSLITNILSGTYSVTITDASSKNVSQSYFVGNCVEWADPSGVALQGNTIIDNSPNGWGNAGANSYNILNANQNGWIQMPVTSLTTETSFGLTAIYSAPDYRTFSFSFLIKKKSLYVYERGITKAFLGHVKINDVLMIQRNGSTINYLKNGVIIYQSNPPSTNPILAADFTTDLVGSASLFTNGAIMSNVTCSFSNRIKVDASIVNEASPSSLGSVALAISEGFAPYQVIWNGLVLPSRAKFKRFIDSTAQVNGMAVDSNIYHAMDSMRLVQSSSNLVSGKYSASVIDSINDTISINTDILPATSWFNESGVAITSPQIPRYVCRIRSDSASSLLEGLPNLSQPVITFDGQADSGTITKTSGDGWNKGMVNSINIFPANQYASISFVVPNITTILAAGIKPDSLPNQNGYVDIQYGYYFNKGYLSLIVNGTLLSMGTYNAGNRFTLENTYDSANHLERILYKQNGHLLEIAYVTINTRTGGGTAGNALLVPAGINNTTVNVAVKYLFKAALYSSSSSLLSTTFTGGYPTLSPAYVTVTPASCGFPNTGAISVLLYVNPYFTITVQWTNLATSQTYNTLNLSNLSAGAYSLVVTYRHGFTTIPVSYGTYYVGYKIYWGYLNNAVTLPPTNSNSITEQPFPSIGSGGNSSNVTTGTSPGQWIQFQASPTQNANDALGFSTTLSNNNFNLGNINYGIWTTPMYSVGPPLYTPHVGSTLAFNIANKTVVSVFSIVPAFLVAIVTYKVQNNYLIGGVDYYATVGNIPVGSAHFSYTSICPGPNCPTNATNIAKAAIFNAYTPPFLSNPILANAQCSFVCGDTDVRYSTLTKNLDGSYYLSPYGRLSFRYDEEYVNNGNGLPYKIFDLNHNVLYSGTIPSDNYKDNYYSLDLTSLSSLIYNGYFILQVTNKKGEVTELRFKN
jgi:hypothetical protein